MKKSFLFAGLLFLLLACSKDKNITGTNADGSVNAKSSVKSEPFTENTVHITSSGFSPEFLRVNINNTVVWVNDDNVVHTVTSPSGKFDSGDIPPGSTFRYYFDNTGNYDYYCKYHDIRGTIQVAGIR